MIFTTLRPAIARPEPRSVLGLAVIIFLTDRPTGAVVDARCSVRLAKGSRLRSTGNRQNRLAEIRERVMRKAGLTLMRATLIRIRNTCVGESAREPLRTRAEALNRILRAIAAVSVWRSDGLARFGRSAGADIRPRLAIPGVRASLRDRIIRIVALVAAAEVRIVAACMRGAIRGVAALGAFRGPGHHLAAFARPALGASAAQAVPNALRTRIIELVASRARIALITVLQ